MAASNLPDVAAANGSGPDNTAAVRPVNNGSSTFQLLSEEQDSLGMLHRRYQQLINGLPVEGAIAIEHLRQGALQSVSGEWIHLPPAGLVDHANLNEARALTSALSWVGASSYRWQLPEEEAWLKADSGNPNATYRPSGQLVYYAGASNLNGNPVRLAYRFDIYAQEPLSRQYVYVDALNGKVLGSNSLLQEIDSPGTAYTGYSGQKPITTDYTSGTTNPYRLRENNGTGKNIQTYNLKGKTIYSVATDFTDANNTWGLTDSYTLTTPKDAYALDAHFGAEKTYDYYKSIHGRNSIDDKGFALKSYVHYNKNYFNAFWDGSRMTYGDGSSANGNLPLTSLDVCGHEITHGLTTFTANLNYSYESGALNEGFSDILGTAIEAYARGRSGIGTSNDSWNWKLGEDFKYVIRDMAEPKNYGDPDTYKGSNWYTGTSDNGGVHTNSGVLNYWFALLTEGSGSGVEHSSANIDGNTDTNDFGYNFEVRGLGLDKAQAVAYRTLTKYLTNTSNYADARQRSLQAATDLATSGLLTSEDAGEVAYAWNAVAVGGGTTSTYKPTFTGTSQNDTLHGGHLADIITGQGGSDQSWGNGGADTFVLADALTQYYASGGRNDLATINDFNAANGDKLQLAKSVDYFFQNSGANTEIFRGTDSSGDVLASLTGQNLGSGSFNDASASSAGISWAQFV